MTDNEIIRHYDDNLVLDADVDFYESEYDLLIPVLNKILKESESQCLLCAPGYLSVVVGEDKNKWYFSMLNDQKIGYQSNATTPIRAIYNCVLSYIKDQNL